MNFFLLPRKATVAILLLALAVAVAFPQAHVRPLLSSNNLHLLVFPLSLLKAGVQTEDAATARPCYYKRHDGKWTRRLDLADLEVGQKLYGRKLNQDLLDGKTGPKVFFECGVGRIDAKGNWQMVNGMLRLGSRFAKKSVTKKRIRRLKDKGEVELYVSKIRSDNGHFEVSTSLDEVQEKQRQEPPKTSASTLTLGQELVGTVVRIMPFGVMVDVGANRNGLLHIQKVADLYGRYIDKEKGLEEAGLERGARIRIAVESNERKRLFLDFTDDVKKEAKGSKEEQQSKIKTEAQPTEEEQQQDDEPVEAESQSSADDVSEDKAVAWGAYGAEDDQYEEDDQDDYDEDRDIEDALGIGNY